MSKHKPLPSLHRVKELLKVETIPEHELGKRSGLVRKITQGNKIAGSLAGHRQKHPRQSRYDWVVKIDDIQYIAARIIFYIEYGIDPGDYEVDHKDRNPDNNNIKNLRLVLGRSDQTHNRGLFKNNTSGAIGVTWVKQRKKWMVQFHHNGVKSYLGLFTCKLEAARTYNEAVKENNLIATGKPLNKIEALACNCPRCCQSSKRSPKEGNCTP